MPGKLKVRVLAGRDLPIMDRASELTDAFVEIKFINTVYKTDVCRKSLNPQWNSEWYRFEVDDENLQDEPLEIKVLDHDTYSAHDAIGKVYIDLNPLLAKDHGLVISGWFPLYDTMHGIRGEIQVCVKVELFSDVNRFRQSSCGVQFFCSSGKPYGYHVAAMHGFVEELVVNDDPEYQWIDKIRTQRASNEARQKLFSKLSGELQRKIGLKALELGGNSVISYKQCFDLEGESGIVVRAIGTVVTLNKFTNFYSPQSSSPGRDMFNTEQTLHGPQTHKDKAFRYPSKSLMHAYRKTAVPSNVPTRAENSSKLSVYFTSSKCDSLSKSSSSTYIVSSEKPCFHTSTDYRNLGSCFGEIRESDYDAEDDVFVEEEIILQTNTSTPVINLPSDISVQSEAGLCKTRSNEGDTQPKLTEAANSVSRSAEESVRLDRSRTDGSSSVASKVARRRTVSCGSDLGYVKCTSPFSVCVPEDSVAPCSPVVTPTLLSPSPVRPALNITTTSTSLHRRSSDSDLGTPPRGGSLTGSSGSVGGGSCVRRAMSRPVIHQQTIDMMEYPFFTMTSLPPGFLVHIGGVVSARSVKLLDKIHNPDEPETRDAWWTELRTEIRSHTRAMGCHAVLGYIEQTTICDEVIILSASGTAAIVNLHMDQEARHNTLCMSLDRHAFEKERDKDKKLHVDVNLANLMAQGRLNVVADGNELEFSIPNCGVCHVPYNETSAPFPITLTRCAVCRKHKVPDVLFSTLQPPPDMPTVGRGCLIQSRICRAKKEGKGETNAKEISDSLPFMEYELHNQLINKLKIKGMNSLFGLRVQVSVGEKLLVAVATATAVYCAALPPPPIPCILGKTDMSVEDKHIQEMQRKIIDTVNRNKEIYGVYPVEYGFDHSPRSSGALTDESEDEQTDLDLISGNKDTFVLEIDDAEDVAVVSILLDPPVPDGFDVCNTERLPGLPNMDSSVQMFTRVWRGQLSLLNNRAFSSLCDSILRSLFFKMRKMAPCCLCDMDFNIDLPEDDDIQICVSGVCVGLSEPHTLANGLLGTVPPPKAPPASGIQGDRDDMMFQMEGVSDAASSGTTLSTPAQHLLTKSSKNEKKIKYHEIWNTLSQTGVILIEIDGVQSAQKQNFGIEITAMSYIPGARIEHYLGHLNFFMIRESTAIREDGGLNGFIHSFIGEVMAIMRAHVSALGGNALVAYQLNQCVLEDNLSKNQAQCLVNVYGDVVQVNYSVELPMMPSVAGHASGGGTSPGNLVRRVTPRNSPRNSPKERLHHRSSTS